MHEVVIDTLWCVEFDYDTPWIKYDSKDLIKLVKSFNNVGGAVTLNAPIFMKDGEIPQESMDKLTEKDAATIIDFFLIDCETLEVTDEHINTWH